MGEVFRCAACQQPLGLQRAIEAHHAQKADDRCVEDDDRIYEAAGLPPCDRRVGSKEDMLRNCERFIDRRCEGGHWPSYVELEAERDALRARQESILARVLEAIQVRPGEHDTHAIYLGNQLLDVWHNPLLAAREVLRLRGEMARIITLAQKDGCWALDLVLGRE